MAGIAGEGTGLFDIVGAKVPWSQWRSKQSHKRMERKMQLCSNESNEQQAFFIPTSFVPVTT